MYNTGLLLLLSGKRPLPLRYDANSEIYWIPRHPAGPAPDTMTNQF